MPAINPNSDRQYIDGLDITLETNFPLFIKQLKFEPFRHIPHLEINFTHPISIISGTNRSGKSTVLMAIACSHFDFKKRNPQNGKFERQTWSSLMQFTSQDKQIEDWTYYITYKIGSSTPIPKRGQRKASTRKWNGIGKKESQFTERELVFLDVDRILPARNFGKSIYKKAQASTGAAISRSNVKAIEDYLSYILEEKFSLLKLAEHLDKDIFKYKNTNEYSSYNAATGEEVLTKLIIDIVESPRNSLILIDEIEIGLHPKIQRKLIDTIYHIARHQNKQFIITSHSQTILSSVPETARIFIEKDKTNFKSIPEISVNAALSKMDSLSYPLFDLFCEDDQSKKIILKAISDIQIKKKIKNFSSLVNVIVVGAADKTYTCFKVHQATYNRKIIRAGYACILDGDQKATRRKTGGALQYPPEDCLHFLYSSESPEKFLVREYLSQNQDATLQYHLENSNSHSLFEKMIEQSLATSKDEAFEICWTCFLNTNDGKAYFQELKSFIINMAKRYSPDL